MQGGKSFHSRVSDSMMGLFNFYDDIVVMM